MAEPSLAVLGIGATAPIDRVCASGFKGGSGCDSDRAVMTDAEDITTSSSTTTSGTILFDIKNTRILWGDNDAELPGLLVRMSKCPQLARYKDIMQDRMRSLSSARCVGRDMASVICYLERNTIASYVPREV